jgi:DNA gyrase/topoisomerase IV subunit B
MDEGEKNFREGLNTYYNLKNEYDTNFENQKIKLIKTAGLSWKEKQKEFQKIKRKCVNCKRPVGTIFKTTIVNPNDFNNERHLIAMCGDRGDPCPLNVDINLSYIVNLNEFIEQQKRKIEKDKNEIILDKNNLLFGYIDSNEAVENFDTIKDILKSEIVETILDWISRKKDADANKLAREVNKNLAKIKVEKLIDAKGKNRQECSLCLFEGDSASSSFRSYRDDNTQGAFCLRGKFVNATDMTNAKLVENKEVLNFMAAMGLRLGEPADPSKLRYGKILIFTDADFDGFSINGLLINFLYKYWPELFINQMVYRVETPIVVSQNLKSKKKINFYTQDEYNKWLKTITPKEWIIKYKKGLAALSDDEYEEIILKPRTILILPDDYSSQSLNVWFGKDSELRKEQLLKLQ